MSFNQPPPGGPYGQQPPGGQPPPGPPQGQPGPPGYGAGQPGPPGYGAQPGYGQQPPPPGPYGQQPPGQVPPPPPPGTGSGNGKTFGIIVAAVVALALVVGGVFLVVGGGDDEDSAKGKDNGATSGQSGGSDSDDKGDGGDDEADQGGDPRSYRLDKPKTLLDGEYTHKEDPRADGGPANPKLADDGKTVAASYEDSDKIELGFVGVEGKIKNVEGGVDEIAGQLSSYGTATKQSPDGFDGDAMKCGTGENNGSTATFCVWGDAGSLVLVVWEDEDGSKAPSVEEFADTTVQVRQEVRVKK